MHKLFHVVAFVTFFLQCLGIGASSLPDRQQTIDYMPFAALGRPIDLKSGAMGSAPTGNLQIDEMKHTYSDTKFSLIESDRDINSIMDINGKKSMDLKLGSEGDGRLFQTNTGQLRSGELMFVHNSIRRSESLKNLESVITNDFCRTIKGQYSHIITGVMYGTALTISARSKVGSVKEKAKIVKDFTKPGGLVASQKGYLTDIVTKVAKMENVSIVCYSNGDLQRVVTNFHDALNLISIAPDLLTSTSGKGVAKYMHLTPLSYYPQCDAVRMQESFYSDIFFDSFAAMLTDMDKALELLRGCISRFSLPASKGNLIKNVKTTLRNLRSVQYTLKVELSKPGMNYELVSFERIARIYSETSSVAWNYKYWLTKVFNLCVAMKEVNIPLEMDITAKLDHNPTLCISKDKKPCVWS